MAREIETVRDGVLRFSKLPTEQKVVAKVRGRERRPEGAREALVSSTQDWSFKASGGMLRRLRRAQLRSRQQALPSPVTFALRQ